MKTLFQSLMLITCIFTISTCHGSQIDSIPTLSAYNAPYSIQKNNCWNFFAQASYLYWEASQDNLEIGSIQTVGVNETDLFLNEITLNFEHKSGFKIGLGVKQPFDDWEILGEYTNFHSKITGGTSFEQVNNILEFQDNWFPIIGAAFLTTCDKIETSWNLDFEQVDLLLSRAYYVGKCLIIKAAGGLQAAWIDQKYTIDCALSSEDFNMGVSLHKTKSWGVGPEIGLQTIWQFYNCFRLLFDIDTSILFTKYTTNRINSTIIDTFDNVLQVPFTINQDQCFLRPNIGLFAGIGWGNSLFCKNWAIDIQTGYSAKLFWDQNMFHLFTRGFFVIPPSSGTINRGGNLYLHGLTVSLNLSF